MMNSVGDKRRRTSKLALSGAGAGPNLIKQRFAILQSHRQLIKQTQYAYNLQVAAFSKQ